MPEPRDLFFEKCPFCKENSKKVHLTPCNIPDWNGESPDLTIFYVECDSCQARGPVSEHDWEHALKLWNDYANPIHL